MINKFVPSFSSSCLRLLFLLLIALCATETIADTGDSDHAKKLMDGTWQLEEWVVDGEPLHPPAAEGRLSHHNGVIMIMMSWASPSIRKYFYGYGKYEFGPSTWSYQYDKYVAFVEENGFLTRSERGAAESSTRAGFEGKRVYPMRFEGERLIMEHEGGQRQLIYEGDVFSYIEHGKPLRKWRRISPE
jgi:hypothetical protein